MTYQFDNGKIVQYDTERFGRGKGKVCGYSQKSGEYIIYPNVEHDYTDYPFLCLMVMPENLISTPF